MVVVEIDLDAVDDDDILGGRWWWCGGERRSGSTKARSFVESAESTVTTRGRELEKGGFW